MTVSTPRTNTSPDYRVYKDPMIMNMVSMQSTQSEVHLSASSPEKQHVRVEYVQLGNVPPSDPDILLGDLIALYEEKTVHDVKRTTENLTEYKKNKNRRTYVSCIRSTFRDMLEQKAKDIEPKSLDAWCEKYMSANKVKASSMNRAITCLCGILRWAAEDENIIEKYNLIGLKRFTESDNGERTSRSLTEEEVKKIFEALARREDSIRKRAEEVSCKPYNKYYVRQYKVPDKGYVDYVIPFVALSLYTGARNGSAVGLKWQDIDFNNKTVTLQKEYSKTGVTVEVPMADDLIDILKVWATQQRVNIADTNEDKRFVFTSRHQKENKPIVSIDKKEWAKLLLEAGIPHARWHDLRHTFASTLIKERQSIFAISKLLGHKSIKTTERYLHLSPEEAKCAISSLDGAFPSQSILVNKGKDKKAA